MNFEEAGELLARVASFDRRTNGEPDIVAWGLALADVDYADAAQAVVDHYRETSEWITPAAVRDRVRRIRRTRIDAAGPITPPAELADDPQAELAWVRAERNRIASGMSPQPRQELPGRPRNVEDLIAACRTQLPKGSSALEGAQEAKEAA